MLLINASLPQGARDARIANAALFAGAYDSLSVQWHASVRPGRGGACALSPLASRARTLQVGAGIVLTMLINVVT